jgi:hypothetical protein
MGPVAAASARHMHAARAPSLSAEGTCTSASASHPSGGQSMREELNVHEAPTRRPNSHSSTSDARPKLSVPSAGGRAGVVSGERAPAVDHRRRTLRRETPCRAHLTACRSSCSAWWRSRSRGRPRGRTATSSTGPAQRTGVGGAQRQRQSGGAPGLAAVRPRSGHGRRSHWPDAEPSGAGTRLADGRDGAALGRVLIADGAQNSAVPELRLRHHDGGHGGDRGVGGPARREQMAVASPSALGSRRIHKTADSESPGRSLRSPHAHGVRHRAGVCERGCVGRRRQCRCRL